MAMSEKRSKIDAPNTRVYMENVIQKVFRRNVPDHLAKLLAGDRDTLEKCAEFLAKNLDFHQLLHTLCLISGKKFDLEEKDHVKGADAWVCWWEENKEHIAWDAKAERWALSK
jgi:hypothetical protein